jgi:hypothetical protein
MAEEEKQVTESQVLPIGVPEWQTSLSSVVNQTYSYATNMLFCTAVGGYNLDYAYRYVKPSVQWLDGYVPALHWSGSGILSTRIASSLINGLTRTLVGEKLVYKIVGDNKDQNAMESLRFISKWGEIMQIKKAVKNAIAYSLGIGTSLLKANKRDNGDIWWEAVRFDNCFYLANASNEVKDATFLLRSYTDTRNKKGNTQYFLAEHRFYQCSKPEIQKNADGTYTTLHKKGERKAMVEYKVFRASLSLTNTMSDSNGRSSVKWSEIPQEVRKLIKEDYATYRIDEPMPLGFTNLGVEALLTDLGDISIPTGSNFGRGLIVPAIDDFIIYEIAESYLLRDMHYGKGTVYIPQFLSIGSYGSVPLKTEEEEGTSRIKPNDDPSVIKFDGANVQSKGKQDASMTPMFNDPLGGLSNKYEKVPGVNPDEQKIEVAQFNLRAAEWQVIQENALKRIAIKWGSTPKILASFLTQQNAQMTATQIDSEDDIGVAWINQLRADFKPAINRLLETTMNYYGRPHNVDIDFASPSIINKDRILDRVIKKLENRLITMEEAIRELNPDLDEETLQAKIKSAKEEQLATMFKAQTEMNDDGTFDNNYDDLGGQNLKGSTSPIQ